MTPYSANLRHHEASTGVALAKVPPVTTYPLNKHDQAEVLTFLQERALHNVVMSSLILDHGIESELCRGTFYGMRDETNRLQGVALIGHATFIDARHDAVIPDFARLAQSFRRIHVVLGEHELVERFWRSYALSGQRLRHRCREILFELTEVSSSFGHVPDLRPAMLGNLPQVAAVQAALAFEESGVNPLHNDRSGFLSRCQRRIERNRVWTWIRNGELIFKADLISETPDVIYLEGIYVNRKERNRGIGSRCLTQLARELLTRAQSIVVLVNENRTGAHRFFQRVGFVPRSLYDTLFLEIGTRGDAH